MTTQLLGGRHPRPMFYTRLHSLFLIGITHGSVAVAHDQDAIYALAFRSFFKFVETGFVALFSEIERVHVFNPANPAFVFCVLLEVERIEYFGTGLLLWLMIYIFLACSSSGRESW